MEDGFFGTVTVAFVGQHDKASRRSVALEGMIEPPGLDGEGSGIVVGFTVDKEDGLVDFVGVHKWRDSKVDFRSLPEGAAFALESERSQRSVVGAAPSHPGSKEIAVGQKVGRHEGSITVPSDADTLGIDDAHGIEFIDGGFCGGHDCSTNVSFMVFGSPRTGI